MTNVQWSGTDSMFKRMQEYTNKVEFAIEQVARYFQAVFERYAKENARWNDRSSNARQTLAAYIDGEAPSKPNVPGSVEYPDVKNLASDTVMLFLSHGMEYGVALETMKGGELGIVWDTIQAHLDAVGKMLQGIFG